MREGQKIEGDPRVGIANIERILPVIEEKLTNREEEQAEYASIKLRIPALKRELADAERKYVELRDEINLANKRAVRLYLRIEPSPFMRFHKGMQQIRRVSRTRFLVILILLATLGAYSLASLCYQSGQMQSLSLGIGFALVGFVLFIGLSEYRYLTGAFVLAMLIIISTAFVGDGALKWALISTSIGVVGVGLAIQTFSSGGVVERKLEKMETLERKLDEVLERLPESPATGSQQSQPPRVIQQSDETR